MTNTLYPFDNYFLQAEKEFTTEQQWDLVKAIGFTKYYFSISRDKPESWAIATSIRANRQRTGLGLAAAYTIIDLSKDESPDTHSVPELMDQLDPGDVLELALTRGWQADISDTQYDDQAVELLTGLVAEAEKRDIHISLYHHIGFWQERIEDCVRLAEKVSHPRLGVTFCGYHWYAVDGTELGARLKLAQPWLKLANVCGSRQRPEGNDFPLEKTIEPVGQGTFPLAEYIAELRAIDYTGDIGFQGYLIRGNPEETLRQSWDAWHKAIA